MGTVVSQFAVLSSQFSVVSEGRLRAALLLIGMLVAQIAQFLIFTASAWAACPEPTALRP